MTKKYTSFGFISKNALLIATFSFFSLTLAAHADVRFDSSNANCVLKKYESGKWVFASISELDGKRFKNSKPTPNNSRVHAVMDKGKWYNADVNCFVDAAATSLQAASSGDVANNGGGNSTDTTQNDSSRLNGSASGNAHDGSASNGLFGFSNQYFVDAGVGFLVKRGVFEDAGSVTESGLTSTYPKATVGTQIFLRLGVNFNAQFAGFFHFSQTAVEQTSAFTGTVTGTGKVNYSQYPLAVGLMYRLGSAGTFVPYLSGAVGLAIRKGEVKLTGFSSTLLNGLTEFSGSGLYYSPEIGAEIRVHHAIYLVPYLRYEVANVKKTKVTTSTSSAFSVGDESEEDKSKFVTAGLGLRFNF